MDEGTQSGKRRAVLLDIHPSFRHCVSNTGMYTAVQRRYTHGVYTQHTVFQPTEDPGGGFSETTGRRNIWQVYLPATLCFFVICITNETILSLLGRTHMLYRSNAVLPEDVEKTARFFLSPTKEFIFFFCSTILLWPLCRVTTGWFKRFLTKSDYIQTILALFCCGILTATLIPESFGRQYARISINPFNESNGQLNRRLLLPALAHIWHFNGYLFTAFFWGTIVLAALLLKLYLKRRNSSITLFQEVALLSTGVIAASFETPGYPEGAVLSLSLIALLSSDQQDELYRRSTIPLAAFALALMAHEAAAILMFVPLFLFILSRRYWWPAAGLVGAYVIAVAAGYQFHISAAWNMQSHVSSVPAQTYFVQHPLLVLDAAAFSFKALWILVAVGVFYLWKSSNRRQVFYVLSAFLIAFAATYIAVDYSRLISFATLPVFLCFAVAQRHLATRVFNGILFVSLLFPSLYVGGNVGIVSERGLYRSVYHKLHLIS